MGRTLPASPPTHPPPTCPAQPPLPTCQANLSESQKRALMAAIQAHFKEWLQHTGAMRQASARVTRLACGRCWSGRCWSALPPPPLSRPPPPPPSLQCAAAAAAASAAGVRPGQARARRRRRHPSRRQPQPGRRQPRRGRRRQWDGHWMTSALCNSACCAHHPFFSLPPRWCSAALAASVATITHASGACRGPGMGAVSSGGGGGFIGLGIRSQQVKKQARRDSRSRWGG